MKVLGVYPSKSSNTSHEVRLGDDNVIYCTCPGWRFHSRRWCKHLEEWQSNSWKLNTTLVGSAKMFKEQVTAGDPLDTVTQSVIAELINMIGGRQ